MTMKILKWTEGFSGCARRLRGGGVARTNRTKAIRRASGHAGLIERRPRDGSPPNQPEPAPSSSTNSCSVARRNRLLRGFLTDMKITTPPLLKMRSVVSEDGRWARFFLLFKTGQNAAFSLPFSDIGLFLKAVKSVTRTMTDRVAARGEFSSAEIADGLAEAVTVKSVARGRDTETGDRLLWVETNDSGVFSLQLSREATEMVADALRDDQEERKDGRITTSNAVRPLRARNRVSADAATARADEVIE